MKDPYIPDRIRLFEILAVVSTAIGKFIFMDYLNLKLPFIVMVIIIWTVYVMYRRQRIADLFRYWGFRADNLGLVTKKVLPFGLFAVIFFVLVGIFRGTINITWHIIPVLVLYPIWGVVQQFLVLGLVVGNLQDINSIRIDTPIIVLTAALLFGLLHYPFPWLMAGTFILALFYGFIFLRSRNLYVMGLLHGWLGGLFFYTLVDRDPYLEVFSRYLN